MLVRVKVVMTKPTNFNDLKHLKQSVNSQTLNFFHDRLLQKSKFFLEHFHDSVIKNYPQVAHR